MKPPMHNSLSLTLQYHAGYCPDATIAEELREDRMQALWQFFVEELSDPREGALSGPPGMSKRKIKPTVCRYD